LFVATFLLWFGGERHAERQLRAYVTIVGGGMTLVNLVEGGMGLLINLELKNSGQTPGYNFTTWIKEPKLLDKDDLPFGPATPFSERTGTSIIGPGASVHINWTMPIDAAGVAAIGNGSKKVFVWGGADFIDAFKKPRFFIFRSVNAQGILNAPGARIGVNPHKAGYEAN
jgi:hypothetical protein